MVVAQNLNYNFYQAFNGAGFFFLRKHYQMIIEKVFKG